jgi:hypothetical protein
VRLVDVVELGREMGPARLRVAQQQRRLHPEHGSQGSRREANLPEEGALQGSLGGPAGRAESTDGDPSPRPSHRLDRAVGREIRPGALQPAAEERGEDGGAPKVGGCVLDAREQRAPVPAEEVLERAPTVGEAVRVVVEHAAEGGGPEADRDGPELRGR